MIPPVLRRISHECEQDDNTWFADNGNLVGRLGDVRKALDIILQEGHSVQYLMRSSLSRASYSTMNREKLRVLTSIYPLVPRNDVGGSVLMGAPLGTQGSCSKFCLIFWLWLKLP